MSCTRTEAPPDGRGGKLCPKRAKTARGRSFDVVQPTPPAYRWPAAVRSVRPLIEANAADGKLDFPPPSVFLRDFNRSPRRPLLILLLEWTTI